MACYGMLMLGKLRTWAAGLSEKSDAAGSRVASPGLSELATATALLLVEAATLDGDFDDDEERCIRTLLTDRLNVSAADAAEVIADAKIKHEGHVALQGLTRTIKDQLPPQDRVAILEMIWEVAYADGKLHDYESNLARRVAGLLYIDDRENGAAKKRVIARLEQKSNPA